MTCHAPDYTPNVLRERPGLNDHPAAWSRLDCGSGLASEPKPAAPGLHLILGAELSDGGAQGGALFQRRLHRPFEGGGKGGLGVFE